MKFVPSVWQDIRKYYENTYVKFAEFGDELFYISRVRETEITGKDEKGEDFVLDYTEDAPYELTYTLPHKGLFSYNGTAHMLTRIPAVQYSRGITQANTRIVDIGTGKELRVTFVTLQAFVQKQPYVSMEDALFGKGNTKALCLSRRIAYHKPRQMFYVDTTPVALFQRDTQTIVPATANGHLFFPELKELLAPHSPIKFSQV